MKKKKKKKKKKNGKNALHNFPELCLQMASFVQQIDQNPDSIWKWISEAQDKSWKCSKIIVRQVISICT